MGRGLAAILSVSDRKPDEHEQLRSLPLDVISPSPNQPRKAFDENVAANEKGDHQTIDNRLLPDDHSSHLGPQTGDRFVGAGDLIVDGRLIHF